MDHFIFFEGGVGQFPKNKKKKKEEILHSKSREKKIMHNGPRESRAGLSARRILLDQMKN